MATVLSLLGPDERLCGGDRVGEGLAAHRPGAVDGEHYALRRCEILGTEAAADGIAVLLQRRGFPEGCDVTTVIRIRGKEVVDTSETSTPRPRPAPR